MHKRKNHAIDMDPICACVVAGCGGDCILAVFMNTVSVWESRSRSHGYQLEAMAAEEVGDKKRGFRL